MKTKTISIAVVLGFSFLLTSTMTTFGQNQFQTKEEAVQKAQQDLIQILESGLKIDMDVTVEQVREAKPMMSIAFNQVNFEALINSENAESFNQLKTELVSYIVPLANKEKIVTLIQVYQVDKMWKVSGIGDNLIKEDLNKLPSEAFNEGFSNLKIYEVPNIQANIYVLDLRAEEVAFSNYGNYNIREGVKPASVIEVLKGDAIQFQKQWGDLLKEGKLVK